MTIACIAGREALIYQFLRVLVLPAWDSAYAAQFRQCLQRREAMTIKALAAAAYLIATLATVDHLVEFGLAQGALHDSATSRSSQSSAKPTVVDTVLGPGYSGSSQCSRACGILKHLQPARMTPPPFS